MMNTTSTETWTTTGRNLGKGDVVLLETVAHLLDPENTEMVACVITKVGRNTMNLEEVATRRARTALRNRTFQVVL